MPQSIKASLTLTVDPAGAGPFVPPPAPPIPMEGVHPRLGMTPADVVTLQSKAVASNPYYAAFKGRLTKYTTYYNQFFPNGTGSPTDIPANPFPDTGDTQGYPSWGGNPGDPVSDGEPITKSVEAHAWFWAFASLIATDPVLKAQYAGRARNLLMIGYTEMAKGVLKGAPFRDPQFFVYNRNNGGGPLWATSTDRIYPYLSASDKATIRQALIVWNQQLLTNGATGGDWPIPVGLMNSPSLVPYRMAMNNYYLGHFATLVHNCLCMDLADDPQGLLRNYLSDAIGAWLYQIYAMIGEPDQLQADYGLATSNGLGWASGGMAPEGPFYGQHLGAMFRALLVLQTCGVTDPSIWGPQVKAITCPMVSRFTQAYLSWFENSPVTIVSWQGQLFRYPCQGDSLYSYVLSDVGTLSALLQLLEGSGNTSQSDALRWAILNTPQGGISQLGSHLTYPGRAGGIDPSIALQVLNPAPYPADPRPAMPLTFIDKGLSQLVSRTDWGPKASSFYYTATTPSINHIHAWAGGFTLYRKGEKLTGWMANYDNNGYGLLSPCGNTLAVKNQQGIENVSVLGIWGRAYVEGSQFWIGGFVGDASTTFDSVDNDYAYAASDLTNLYNRIDKYTSSNSAIAVTKVFRRILWLPTIDAVVIYDECASRPSLFKRQWFCTPLLPTISGNQAFFDTTTNRLTIESFDLANTSITAVEQASKMNPLASAETMKYLVCVTDPSNPDPCAFLTVLRGTDAGVAVVPAIQLDRTSVQIGSTVVAFGAVPSGLPSGTTVYQCGTGGKVTKSIN